jgi:hypothetical protein
LAAALRLAAVERELDPDARELDERLRALADDARLLLLDARLLLVDVRLLLLEARLDAPDFLDLPPELPLFLSAISAPPRDPATVV